jgi:DNA-binding IclR family transcriptional regulator
MRARRVGDRSAEVIRYIGQHPQGVTPAEVAAALDMDPTAARVYLRRADEAGRISRPRRGLYTPVTSVTSVTSEGARPSESNASNTPSGNSR